MADRMEEYIITNSWGVEQERILIPCRYRALFEEFASAVRTVGYSDGRCDEAESHETW